jgi:hypothetical protein
MKAGKPLNPKRIAWPDFKNFENMKVHCRNHALEGMVSADWVY